MIILETLKFISLLIVIIITVAFYTVLERKLMGSVQHRYGPNLVGL
jgi:NADH:ubiquinone oxidoreductase subunit H